MQLRTITSPKEEAHMKWKEYCAAVKKDPRNVQLRILKTLFWEAKHGGKLIDIREVLRSAGYHDKNSKYTNMPKLGLAPVLDKQGKLSKTIYCHVTPAEGYVAFSDSNWNSHPGKRDNGISLPGLFKTWIPQQTNRWFKGKAPVPLIPPQHKPAKLDAKHWILWEVDVWEEVAPVDPVLLYRLTDNIFRVDAQWDLTDIERLALQDKLY